MAARVGVRAAGLLAVVSKYQSFPIVLEDKPTNRNSIGDVALPPDGRLIYAADLYQDSAGNA